VDLELEGLRILITGGSRGIGRSAAEVLTSEGARVAIASRSPEETASELGALPLAVDLATAAGCTDAVAGAAAALGGLDVLVNNAGAAELGSFEEISDERWQHGWDTNVMSAIRCIRAALPELRRSQSAAIVNVSSTAGKRPSTGMPDYSVQKAALLSVSRLVADLYAKEGVRCNAVCPGPTLTDAWLGPGGLADQTAAGSQATRAEVLDRVGSGRPMGRMAEPEEIAVIVAFLCSPRASYVTGAAWGADGGTVPVII
jgi:NAD(P)-dependent dehydrogenase (short-subunit alcohol dehydrogenase family)